LFRVVISATTTFAAPSPEHAQCFDLVRRTVSNPAGVKNSRARRHTWRRRFTASLLFLFNSRDSAHSFYRHSRARGGISRKFIMVDSHAPQVLAATGVGGPTFNGQNLVNCFFLYDIANASGSTGVDVSTTVVWPNSTQLPSTGNYFVDVETSQDCAANITSKSNTGFTVTLVPKTANNSIAAGTFNVMVTY
jgi:hypothetical protein